MRFLFLLICLALPVSAAAKELKVLTLNVWGVELGLSPFRAQRIEKLREILTGNARSPLGWDIVLLQEVWSTHDQKRLALGTYPFHTTDLSENKASGLMILSRYPITQKYYFPLKTKIPWGREFAFLSKKGLLLSKLDVPGVREPLWVGNSHLTASYSTEGLRAFEDVREAQIKELVSIFGSFARTGPAILGGDLNTTPQSALWKIITTEHLQAFQAAPTNGNCCTFGFPNSHVSVEKSEGQLDHLFGSKEHFVIKPAKMVLTKKYRLPREPIHLSDHFGLETVFQVKPRHTCESFLTAVHR